MQRLGMVIGIRPEKIDEYKRLHAEVWPEVLERLKQTHIKNRTPAETKVNNGRQCNKYFLWSDKK